MAWLLRWGLQDLGRSVLDFEFFHVGLCCWMADSFRMIESYNFGIQVAERSDTVESGFAVPVVEEPPTSSARSSLIDCVFGCHRCLGSADPLCLSIS